MNPISIYLDDIYKDWQSSLTLFSRNIFLRYYWPVPFFGNPASAVVATVGVNPSSGEFSSNRNWTEVNSRKDWKLRLKHYFNFSIQPHQWFDHWRIGLKLLEISYEAGTAAHFDVSYRPTKAMLKNKATNAAEFRQMVERDVACFFRLLLLCPNLRLLLVYGPIVRANGSAEGLMHFLLNKAPLHGFKVAQVGKYWSFKHAETGKIIHVHEVSMPGEKCITCQIVKNLYKNCDELRCLLT